MKSKHPSARSSILPSTPRRAACAAAGRAAGLAAMSAAIVAGMALAGCGRDQPAADARPGQALASVNGEEITILQLNEEMQRAGVPAAREQAGRKQLLQALIDRELLEKEAVREKLDRDPKVMQAIERARSLIIAQAYMQKAVGEVGRPTQAEIEDYYNQHPQFFANRRQLALQQLVMPASAVTPELRAAADKATSLDDVAALLDTRQVAYGRAQVTRSTADLKPELAAKLLSMPRGQLFLVHEGQRALLSAVDEVHDAPVSLDIAAPQIAQYLANRKSKEMAQAEIQRLRASARIAYLNKDLAPDAATLPRAAPAALAGVPGTGQAVGAAAGRAAPPIAGQGGSGPAAAGGGAGNADKAALDRGVAGLE